MCNNTPNSQRQEFQKTNIYIKEIAFHHQAMLRNLKKKLHVVLLYRTFNLHHMSVMIYELNTYQFQNNTSSFCATIYGNFLSATVCP